MKIHELPFHQNEIYMKLINTSTKEFYGFHSNHYLTYQNFSGFRLENDEQIVKVIESSDFSDENLEKLFFDTFMKSLFEAMKKRFPI